MTAPAVNLSLCFFSHSARIDGAERSLLQLITELISDNSVICTVVLPSEGPLQEKLEQAGAATVVVDYSWWCSPRPLPAQEINAALTKSFHTLLGTLPSKLAVLNPDVVVTNTMVIPWGAVMASLLNKPHVWYVREFGELDHDLKFFRPFKDVLEIITESSNLVLTNSGTVRSALFGESPGSKIVAVYNNIEIDTAALGEETEPKVFSRPNATKLIITGGIAKRKGQDDAIRAVKELIAWNKEVELIIMGSATPYLKELQTLVSDQNLETYVKFLDFRENPYPVVNQADIVLVCSRAEAFGRVTAEAMLLSKPVIGTNAGGTRELIKAGFNGLLYESGDYRQLAEKIKYLIDQPERIREFGEHGFKFARSSFSREEYGTKVYKLLKDLKGQGNPLSANYFDFLKESMLALHDKWNAEEQLSIGKVARTEEEVAQLQARVQARSQELVQKEEEIALLQARVQAHSQELVQKEEEIAQYRALLTTLRDEVAENQATMRAQQQAFAEIEEENVRLQATMENLRKEITSIEGSLGWLISDRFRRAKDKSRLLSLINSAVVIPIKRRTKVRESHEQEEG